MPLFTYICRHDHTHKVVRKNAKKPAKCPECGGVSRRLFNAVRVNVFAPYVTDHGGGEPEEIRTAAQEDNYCQRKHLSRMLDSESFDPARSKRRREERSRKALERESMAESVQAADRVQEELFT